MPLVVIRAGDVKSGVSAVYLLEHTQWVDYIKLQQFVERVTAEKGATITLSKEMLSVLLGHLIVKGS